MLGWLLVRKELTQDAEHTEKCPRTSLQTWGSLIQKWTFVEAITGERLRCTHQACGNLSATCSGEREQSKRRKKKGHLGSQHRAGKPLGTSGLLFLPSPDLLLTFLSRMFQHCTAVLLKPEVIRVVGRGRNDSRNEEVKMDWEVGGHSWACTPVWMNTCPRPHPQFSIHFFFPVLQMFFLT